MMDVFESSEEEVVGERKVRGNEVDAVCCAVVSLRVQITRFRPRKTTTNVLTHFLFASCAAVTFPLAPNAGSCPSPLCKS